MFDSPSCKRPFTPVPLSFNSWGESEWLKYLLLAISLLLGILVIRWLSGWIRSKPRMRRPKLLLLTGITALLLVMMTQAEQGFTLFLPKDSGEPTEAIVVLGRGIEFGLLRVDRVAELWQTNRAPIFVSGMGDTPRMLAGLQEKGIPQQMLDGENCSQTTPENAIFSAAILQTRGIRRILLVTDPPHMWRALHDFRDEGFTVIPHTSSLPANLSFPDKSFLLLREYLFLFTSGIERQFRGSRLQQLNTPELSNLVKAAKEYAQANSST